MSRGTERSDDQGVVAHECQSGNRREAAIEQESQEQLTGE
jgi:hypothetical protein